MMAEQGGAASPSDNKLRILIADDDPAIGELVTAILTDEGYDVTVVTTTDHDTIATAVGKIEPDCVLLDSTDGPGFGGSWSEAAYLADRERPIPTVMFTGHSDAVLEAREGTSERAQRARFAAVLSKPFILDELLDTVAMAAGRSTPFDRSEAGERTRSEELEAELTGRGATDVRTSNRREWATFTSPSDDRIYQLYWWQKLGRYIVGRYDDEARLEIIGQFYERVAAIDAALGTEAPA